MCCCHSIISIINALLPGQFLVVSLVIIIILKNFLLIRLINYMDIICTSRRKVKIMIQLQGVDACSTSSQEAVPNSKTQDQHIYNFELLFEAFSKIISRKSSILLQKCFSNCSPDVLEEDLNVVSRIFIHSGEIV